MRRGSDGIVTPQPAPVTPVTDWQTVEPLLVRYHVLGEVGRGGMGVVYKAVDRETGDTVAVKVLDARIARDTVLAERFKNELRLARRITHRHVCRVHEFNRAGSVAFLTMEFVDGESVRSLLARHARLPAVEAVRVARQVASALAEAHAAGVVHRDLKPENVMVDRSGVVKVLDFGVARLLESDATTTAGGVLGTPAYMAPEQAMGGPVDARTDLYALGLILYEMLVGRAAFSGETPLALALKQLHETPPPPSAVAPDVPPALDAIVLRCIDKDPARRWGSAAELEAALAAVVPEARATPAGPGTPAGETPGRSGTPVAAGRPTRRHRRRVVGLAAASVVIGLAAWQLAAWYAARRPAARPVAIRQVTLPNGLRVVVSADRRTPTCAVAIGYRAGSSAEEPGRTGLAHLFEHLMFQGSARVGAGEHLALASVYGEANGWIDADYALFFTRVAANQLELALFLEADRLRSLALDDRRFAAERQVVLEERRQVIDNAPFGRARELLYAAAYERFPYGHEPYGAPDDLARLTVADLAAFSQRHVVPGNAVLAVVGDFDADAALEVATRYFGDIPARPVPPPPDLEEPPRTGERRIAATDPFVSTSNVYIAFQGPSGASDDWYALAALARILGQGSAARLHQRLVREAEIAAWVRGALEPRRGPSLFLLTAAARPGADVAAIERAVLAEIERIKTDGVTREELDRVRRQVQRERALQFQTTLGRAVALVDAAVRFGDAALVNTSDGRYEALTPDAVARAARRYLTDTRRIVLVIGPEAARPPGAPARSRQVSQLPAREAAADAERKGLAPVSTAPLTVRFPPTAVRVLDNGLKLVVVEDRRVPLVAGQIGLRGAGALFEPHEFAGLAQATARMLVEGTRARTGREVAELLEGSGASLDVGAPFGSAAATVTFSGLSATFDTWFPLVVEVVRHPAFPPDALNAVKQQLKSSIATSRAQAAVLARATLARLVFGAHPAAVSLPTPEAVDALTVTRLAEWHRTRYGPEQTVVTLAGDVDAERVAASVSRLFGDWARTGLAEALPPAPTSAASRTVAIVDRPGSPQVALAAGNLGVARADADYAAVVVANQVLGANSASRLFRALRDRGDAYNVSSTFTALGYPGLWRIQTDVRPEAVARGIQTLLDELDRLGREPVPADELRESQAAVVAAFALSLEELDRIASYAATRELYGFSADYWDSYPAKIAGVSAADVSRVAHRYLDPRAVQIVVVGDRAQLAPALAPFRPVALEEADALWVTGQPAPRPRR
jgi:zinc protease